MNTPVFSQESRSTCRAGQVVMVAGQVEAHDGSGNSFPLAAGEWLCANTKLVTGHDGKLVVRLSDKDTNLRLNSDSEIVLRPTAFGGDVSLSAGIMHFLSSVKTQFSVHTRLLSAGIDGTEAIVHVSDADGVLVALREGLVTTRQGELQLPVSKRGVAYAAPNEAVRLVAAGDVQSLPPAFRSYVVDFDGQVDWAIYYPPALLRTPGTDETAANLLAAGRTSEAEAHLQCAASKIAPSSAPLCVLSAVMRNDGVAANRLLASRQDDSAAWRMAASYAWQLNGQLRAAEQEAEAGLRLDPNNQFAVARLAEILLLRGSARAALQMLPDHKAGCGDHAMIAAVTGFALLADHGTRDALKRFDCAIALDQGLPLAHLGRGLALVRLGKLAEGRAELENAASLDPRRASLRTTLGRAYFDELETDKAAAQFELARDEDPDNGQSYLMTAVERFAANDPIAALQAISAAGARGDTRAAVRDARGLNEDAAVNGTALGRAYSVLGFDQLAMRAGSGAVSRDPGNPGSHRFLAESYQGRSGMDVARTSELLQAELFSGPSKAPIQAQAGEVHLGLLESAGPARVTFREFGPLFDAEGFRFDVSGAIGTDQRAGGEVSASGLHQGFSIAAGQFYFQDDGIGANSDQRELISATRVRLAPNSAVSLMGEFSFRDSETGDLTEDLIGGISDQRVEQQDRRARLGIKVSPTADIDLYALYTFRDRSVDQAIASADDFLSALDEDGHQVQVRGDFRPRDDLVFVVGGEAGRAKTSTAASFVLTLPPFFPAPPPIRVPIGDFDTETRQAAGYAYAYWSPTDWIDITGGLAFNHYQEDPDGPSALEINRVSPKLGVEIRPIPEITLRAAVFQSVKHRFIFDQTLEPTQIAGFNQAFQDFNGTESTTFGVGADWNPVQWLWLGGEATWRDLDQPLFVDSGRPTASIGAFDGSADTVRGYIGATLGPQVAVAVSAEHTTLKLSQGAGSSDELNTLLAPASVRWFHPIGMFASAEAVYYNQDLTRISAAAGQSTADTDGVVVNLASGYRLPNQRGVLSIEVLNLLDRDVKFQEPSYRVGDVGTRQLARGLTVTVRGTLKF